MEKPVFVPSQILLPNPQTNLQKWAVLACDQFTSQPEYWQQVDKLVGDAPSTLRIILPEVYLEQPGVEGRITAIHAAMQDYLDKVLSGVATGFVYVERTLSTGVRQGLVGCVDLEAYDYAKGSSPRVRPTENTVVERIPPRLAVRRGAKLESPHILMLCDDPGQTVIEPLAAQKQALIPLYDLELMMDGGRIQGWAVTGTAEINAVTAALAALEDPAAFAARYPGAAAAPFGLAVGDGNHSLATAKAAWEEIKPTLSGEALNTHPARYCLVELENIQSPAIDIEPIHRVIFGVKGEAVLKAAQDYAEKAGAGLVQQPARHTFTLLWENKEQTLGLNTPAEPLAVGSVEAILALCGAQNPGMKVDYVHGDEAVRALVASGEVGILLPALEKGDLFRGVALGGVLPKKTFSMGHANEKRYYMECRQIL